MARKRWLTTSRHRAENSLGQASICTQYIKLNNYMALDQHAANLISLTTKAFGGDATSVSIIDGISLIDSWISFLKTDSENTKDVLSGLDELKAELTGGRPDAARVQQLLQDLSQQTKGLTGTVDADDQSSLATLSDSLNALSQQIGGTGHPAPTGGQAPMASTVGGGSSRSGTGASALTSNDEDLARRTGGTTRDA